MDLDGYHFYEPFFHQSLTTYRVLCRTPPKSFLTSLEALESLTFFDSICPSGFIFHGARCGSTLLARVLGRSRTNLVFNEAEVHHLIWKVLNGDRAGIALYRSLALAMGRRRLTSYAAHFVKYASFSIMHFDRIRTAFPSTPALFLFRRPDAVLQSFRREEQPWLGKDVGIDRIWLDAEAALETFYQAALSVRDPLFRYLDYADLGPDRLAAIIEFFGQERPPEELRLMQSQFRWSARGGITPRLFVPRPIEEGYASPALWDLYGALSARATADWR
jgi:hypothetical protein